MERSVTMQRSAYVVQRRDRKPREAIEPWDVAGTAQDTGFPF